MNQDRADGVRRLHVGKAPLCWLQAGEFLRPAKDKTRFRGGPGSKCRSVWMVCVSASILCASRSSSKHHTAHGTSGAEIYSGWRDTPTLPLHLYSSVFIDLPES